MLFRSSDEEARAAEADSPEGERFRQRLADYSKFLREIGQEQAEGAVKHTLAKMRAELL